MLFIKAYLPNALPLQFLGKLLYSARAKTQFLPVPRAMRDIQLEMLRKYEYPYYWGSFIPAGNWQPMEGGL